MASTILCATTLLLQFSSTLLLSDLNLGTLPGLERESTLPYDFDYQSQITGTEAIDSSGWDLYYYNYDKSPVQKRTSTWLRNPPAYPAFAEYAEQVTPSDGIDDTRVLLRAFLPR